MTIDGLTQEQCNMLDAMWDKDTVEELFDFFKSLSKEKYEMAITLYEIMTQESHEGEVEKSLNLSVNMLKEI